MNTVLSKNIVKADTAKRTFSLELSRDTALSFIIMAASKGLTPEQLLESFISDIVSAHSFNEISEEENNLKNWFNGSWFSQDDEEYFSFLQYSVCTNIYSSIVDAGLSVRRCNAKINNGEDSKNQTVLKEKHLSYLKRLFGEYCLKNKAHLSFEEEMREVMDFYFRTDEIIGGDDG